MHSFLKASSYLLLLFNGLTAIYGGGNLVAFPDGHTLGLDIHMFEYRIFKSFLLPGILLLILNGAGSFTVILMMLYKYRKYHWMVMTQGAVLTLWILIQMILMQRILPVQMLYGYIGLALMLNGWWLTYIHAREQTGTRQRR